MLRLPHSVASGLLGAMSAFILRTSTRAWELRMLLRFLSLILLLHAGVAGAATITGSGNTSEETRPVGGFTSLTLRAPIDVTLKAGSIERVTLRGDDNILPLIETRVVDGRLEIGVASNASFTTRRSLTAVVEFVKMSRVVIASSGNVRADTIKADVLEAVIQGSGDMGIDRVEANTVALSIGGSGDFTAKGRADSVGIVINGSGDAYCDRLEADQVAVSIRGSGDVRVAAARELKVNIDGSGDVRYRGRPKVVKSISGSGDVLPLH